MKKAFTMLELIFVIVVIGILASVALPKFAGAGHSAHITKAKNTLAIVRSAISIERQRRILSGHAADNIIALNMDDNNATVAYNAFDHFDRLAEENTSKPVMESPVKACISNSAVACWSITGNNVYTYHFPDSTMGNNGEAKFTLQNNRLECTDTEPADCALLES